VHTITLQCSTSAGYSPVSCSFQYCTPVSCEPLWGRRLDSVKANRTPLGHRPHLFCNDNAALWKIPNGKLCDQERSVMLLIKTNDTYTQRSLHLRFSYHVTVAKRRVPCCGSGVRRTGGVYSKPTVVLLLSPGDEDPAFAFSTLLLALGKGLCDATRKNRCDPGEGYICSK
jgi:hypothetical protein